MYVELNNEARPCN